MSKPAIVIVPGSFTGPEFYDSLSSILQKEHGFEVIVGALQSASRSPPEKPATLQEDAAYFRGIVEALSSQGKDIVIVGHSFGGAVATQSVKSVTKPERQAAGADAGGAVRMVYLASVLPDIGQAPLEAMGGQLGQNIKILGDFMHIDADAAAPVFFPGLPSDVALDLARKLKCQSTLSFLDPPNYTAVDHVPVTYIYTTKDNIIPVEYQQVWVEKLKQRNAKKVSTVTIDEHHYAPTLAPEVTAKAIVEAITQD
ncbi:hypothetical protein UA08_04852 [Talaromyces atroroseus]|uniref:AB hydrolase-1 domain-containing protein n=1 Tax=Talaromyces atroroseus TaxID=1441469 RepID=A0A225AF51_TALAT|nr:hypothetical protein UA08_04852 [Talaromyces atroroseus]OKL59932.1 hypothetical protein UA08_04852 [Talaromyces atroroseus]